VLRHPWKGPDDACEAMKPYAAAVQARQEREAEALASLTGWDIKSIRTRMALASPQPVRWWESMWK
jgi:hypothetical protein